MKTIQVVVLAAFASAVFAASAAEEERVTFGKWRIGVGAAFNAGVRANLGARNLPAPSIGAVPYGSSKAKAEADALARRWQDGAAFIADDLGYESNTGNWRLPVSAYDKPSSTFTLDNPYQEVIDSRTDSIYRDGSADEMQYGLSIELARELWIHDENDEHRWGVDFAAAFSYFFKRDIYSANGTVSHTDEVRDGAYRTTVTDPAAMWDYDHYPELYPPIGGMYGCGTGSGYERTSPDPVIEWSNVHYQGDIGGPSHLVSSSYGYHASGDYRELEMLFMLRPWYEIKDWWRVYGQVGLGVSWGRFESNFSGGGVACDEAFDKWDFYGVAGLGTAFRYKEYTLAVDVLGRFLRDDMDINGRYLSGSIDRSNWGFRVMVGYEF